MFFVQATDKTGVDLNLEGLAQVLNVPCAHLFELLIRRRASEFPAIARCKRL
jgi:hypothetical protein